MTNAEDLQNFLATLLKVQACKLYDNKYMIASTQITNTEIFAFIAVLDFNESEILFIKRKVSRKR